MRHSLRLAILGAAVSLATTAVAGAQVVISIEGDCPGRISVRWEHAAPDEWAGLLFAMNTGNYVLPHICQGTVLGLGSHQLQLVRAFRTGPQGQGEMAGPAPLRVCGGYLQVLVVDGICSTSNVAQIPQ